MKSRIDILCISSWHGVGGAERNAERMAAAFQSRGYNVALCFLFERDVGVPHIIEDHFIIAPGRPKTLLEWLVFLRSCRREIGLRSPRAAFGFHPMANIVGGILVGGSRDGAFVATQRNPSWTQSRYTGLMEAFIGASGLYRANIAVSEAVRNTFSDYSKRYRSKLRVIHNDPPKLPELHCGRDESRAALGVAPNALVLGCVGRLHEQKNFGLAIEALRHVDNAYLYIAGIGPQENYLREQAAQHGVADKVVFAGALQGQDLVRFYRSLDILLAPSIYEGHPMVVLEAMSEGLPIVASDIPEMREVGGSAVVYCGFHAEEWSAAIRCLGADVARRAALATAVKNRAEYFASMSMVDSYLDAAGMRAYK